MVEWRRLHQHGRDEAGRAAATKPDLIYKGGARQREICATAMWPAADESQTRSGHAISEVHPDWAIRNRETMQTHI
jgi:hypothetical protein